MRVTSWLQIIDKQPVAAADEVDGIDPAIGQHTFAPDANGALVLLVFLTRACRSERALAISMHQNYAENHLLKWMINKN